VLENRVLRKIFGPKRDKVTEEWTRLYNKELYAWYISPNTTGRACCKHRRQERCIQGFGGKTCGKETTWVT
jgi:hypothetical protein